MMMMMMIGSIFGLPLRILSTSFYFNMPDFIVLFC